MARTVKDAKLESREARRKLPRQGGKPHYRAIDQGLHLGYRKGATGGAWVMRWYVGNQDYETETIARADDTLDADGVAILSFNQAQAKARELFVLKKREQAGLPAEAGPYTVETCIINEYLPYLDEEKKSGAEARNRAKLHIIPYLGDKLAARLTTKEITDWFRHLAVEPARVRTKKGKKQQFRDTSRLSPEDVRRQRQSSANRTLTVLKAALNKAWREKKIPSDDAWRRVKPFRDVGAARLRYLTVEECKRLINGSAPDFRKVVRAALVSGARYGELARLDVSDFNPDSGTIHVRTSKSGKPRHIVLTDEGQEFFADLTAGRAPDEPMLVKDGGGRWLTSHQSRPMREACEAAKIIPAAGIHTLRHTWASLSVMDGMPLMVVARNMGHADTRMVEAHYGHLAPSFIADEIRAHAPSFGYKPDKKVKRLDRAGGKAKTKPAERAEAST